MDCCTVTCPNCKRTFEANASLETVTCNFCGAIFTVPAPAKIREASSGGQDGDFYFNEAVSALEQVAAVDFDLTDVFTRQGYANVFTDYYSRMSTSLVSLDRAYGLSADAKDALLKEYANALLRAIGKSAGAEDLNALSGARLDRAVYLLVTLMIPSVVKFNSEYSDSLADILVEEWNRGHKKRKIAKSTFEDIDKGFKKRFCFISTAVCTALGRPDDCDELNAFREFRDGYLARQPGGEGLIRDYYLLAPMIVTAINASKEADSVYRSIWTDHLSKCLFLYERHDFEACRDAYVQMVNLLRERWF
jgi:hypothetical protein